MTRTSAMLIAVIVAVMATATLTAPAWAGDDPYGSSTTTRPPGGDPSCQLRDASGEVGSTATVTVRSVPRGTTVRVKFDGQQVAQEEATGPGSSPRVNVDIDFTVPPTDPGEHTVVAEGTDFSVECQTRTGASFEVLGAGQSRGGGGSLARTGAYIGTLVAVGGGLVLGGRALSAESKRRRARALGRNRAGA